MGVGVGGRWQTPSIVRVCSNNAYWLFNYSLIFKYVSSIIIFVCLFACLALWFTFQETNHRLLFRQRVLIAKLFLRFPLSLSLSLSLSRYVFVCCCLFFVLLFCCCFLFVCFVFATLIRFFTYISSDKATPTHDYKEHIERLLTSAKNSKVQKAPSIDHSDNSKSNFAWHSGSRWCNTM